MPQLHGLCVGPACKRFGTVARIIGVNMTGSRRRTLIAATALVVGTVLVEAAGARADRLATEAAWSFNTKG